MENREGKGVSEIDWLSDMVRWYTWQFVGRRDLRGGSRSQPSSCGDLYS